MIKMSQSWGGQVDAKGNVATILEVRFLGTWRCETVKRYSWEPNPNDATLQTQAPLYGPDICPNGQNLKTQLFW